MKSKLQNRKQNGFTIIEVLIVLAIAGLIMLIVFLAVPALSRNSRNTSIKNDVQNVLGGISEFAGANSAKLPTSVTGTGKIDYTSTVPGSNATSINVQGTTKVTTITAAPASVPEGEIQVMLSNKCDGNSAVTPSPRSVAAFYSIETAGNTPIIQCATN